MKLKFDKLMGKTILSLGLSFALGAYEIDLFTVVLG